MKFNCDTIVIGSGPAGLAAAVAAAEAGERVIVLEQLSSPGRKLLASGGGRCNVTNILSPRDMANSFGNACRFVRHALYFYPNEKLCRFLESRGVEMELTDGFHWFPRSGKAKDILDALWEYAGSMGAEMAPGCRAGELVISDGRISGVRAGDSIFQCRRVIIACGGRSYPVLGGTGGGYCLARQAGHKITETFPAMVGLQCAEAWVHECSGIALPDAESRIALPGEKFRCRGELLFTHTGVSAFAILDISGRVSELLAQMPAVPLEINLFAGRNFEDWMAVFARWQKDSAAKTVVKLLSQEMPKKLAAFLVGDPELKVAGFSTVARRKLAEKLTALKLNITSTDGWQKAMVTRGGVALDDIDSRTMESRIVKGLFFAGEVLDVDGPCGGYNISWALASGFLAGKMAGKNA
ncbi:MAG: aminoacetone oxidase family FAD-binding enzyme [Lentisphaerae bacterium]|nr:aminoacetone oxidase family FAD-binding enzyme [Lentisphaerota bacterium]